MKPSANILPSFPEGCKTDGLRRVLCCMFATVNLLHAQTVTLTLDEDYGDSYKATATVTNDTDTAINGWLVKLEFGGPIRSSWSSVIQASESTPAEFKYGISNASYNATIQPGESTSFGFIIDPDNGSNMPASAVAVLNWSLSTGGSGSEPSEYLLHETMDTFAIGPKTDAEWKALWPGSKWANGPDEGRLAVDEAIAYGGSGRSTRVLYPQGGQQPGNSGAQWFIDLKGEYEELYMSYWVRFDDDFDFVLGGKLPGFGGGVSYADRTNEWSGRLMWRENGKAEFYIHVPADNDYDPGDRFWWNTEGFQATFIPGRWHHIEIHMRMNTPGEFDGLAEGWFDGVKAASYPNFYFRDTPTETAKIAWVFFSTFFGGSSSPIWQASKDEYAWFDEFKVSNTRIGYPGLPLDVDSDGMTNTWELTHFGTDTGAKPNADDDNDGVNNKDEFIAGTGPKDAQDYLRLKTFGTADGNAQFKVDAKTGRRYRLEKSANLIDWNGVETVGPFTEEKEIEFEPALDDECQFYRIVVELP